MAIFDKRNFRDSVGSNNSGDKFSHLNPIVVPNKAVARCPEMGGVGTTVVFLPYPNFENPNYKRERDVLPDRLSDDPGDWGPWMFAATGVWKFGPRNITYLFDDPDDAGFISSEHNPAHMIYEAAERAAKPDALIETPFGTSDTDRWGLLLNGGKTNEREIFSCISRPQPLVMAYALVYASGKVTYINEGQALGGAQGDLPVVFVMSRYTAVESMGRPLNATVGEDDNLRYRHKDVTGVKYIHFYDKKKQNAPALQGQAAAMAANAFGGVRRATNPMAPTEEKKDFGFGVLVTDTFSGRAGDPKQDRSLAVNYACATLRPWEETIKGYTPIEAANLIATQCGFPFSLLYHAWKSHPEYYPDELKTRLKSPKSVVIAAQDVHQDTPAPVAEHRTGFSGFVGTVPATTGMDPHADAPWGGNIGDTTTTEPDGFLHDQDDADDGEQAFDRKKAAEANQRLKQYMNQQNNPTAMRSRAQHPPK